MCLKGISGRQKTVLHQVLIYLGWQITPTWPPLRKPINKFIGKYNSCCVVSFKDIDFYSGRVCPWEWTAHRVTSRYRFPGRVQGTDSPASSVTGDFSAFFKGRFSASCMTLQMISAFSLCQDRYAIPCCTGISPLLEYPNVL